jgi:hypothetical protein
MNTIPRTSKCALVLAIGAFLTIPAAFADKPEWAGNKGGKSAQSDRRDDQRSDHNERKRAHDKHANAPQAGHFEERHGVLVRDYYSEQMRGGRCPPGLAKKHNGCMPPARRKNGKSVIVCRLK